MGDIYYNIIVIFVFRTHFIFLGNNKYRLVKLNHFGDCCNLTNSNLFRLYYI